MKFPDKIDYIDLFSFSYENNLHVAILKKQKTQKYEQNTKIRFRIIECGRNAYNRKIQEYKLQNFQEIYFKHRSLSCFDI